jgi:hypothetical protein
LGKKVTSISSEAFNACFNSCLSLSISAWISAELRASFSDSCLFKSSNASNKL